MVNAKVGTMKHAILLIGLTVLVISMTGCKEQTDFANVDIAEQSQQLVPKGLDDNNACLSLANDQDQCSQAEGCQVLFDRDMNSLSCIPIEVPEVDIPVINDPAADDSPPKDAGNGGDSGYNPPNTDYDETDDSYNGGSDYDGLPDSEEEQAGHGGSCKNKKKNKKIEDVGCGNNKVLVCHFPHGDADKAHSLCISQMGYMFGHSRHEGDHLGACDSEDLEEDEE